jgi:hypothetical protein
MLKNYKNVNIKLNNATNSQIEELKYKREFYPRVVDETNIVFTKGEYNLLEKGI